MTEKEKTLALVMAHFMDKADMWRKSGSTRSFEGTQKLVNAGKWDAAAIEMAGLGATPRVVGIAVERYLRNIMMPLFQVDHMHNAIAMAKKGAPLDVIEKVLKFLLKNYCHIWAIDALEELTALVGRKPTREEIFALVKLECSNMTSNDPRLHERLVELAEKYLSSNDVEEIKSKLWAKVKKFNSQLDW